MAKEVDLLSYWMPILRNLKEFKEIAKAEEPELRLLLDAIDRTLANMYIETADEYGIERFESMMGIYPEAGDTLEERRFRVLTKWNDKIPYTEEALRGLLAVLCGEDGYTVKIDYANYKLVVKLSLSNENNINEVEDLLARVVPVNIVTQIMLFNTHTILTAYTHEQLAQYTHKEVREAVL